MSDVLKIDDNGVCKSCEKIAAQGDYLKCLSCKGLFHIVCQNAIGDLKAATKTTVVQVLQPSTKRNFVFFCNCCITKYEIEQASEESKRLNSIEEKVAELSNKLEEMSALLIEQKSCPTPILKNKSKSVWFKEESQSNVTEITSPDPPVSSNSVLVIDHLDDEEVNRENRRIVENVVLDNNICLKDSFENKKGDLIIICESPEKRGNLKSKIEAANAGINLKIPSPRNVISIAGFDHEYPQEEILQQMINQKIL